MANLTKIPPPPGSPNVAAFIEQARNRGRSSESIADSLWEAGWSDEDFNRILPSADDAVLESYLMMRRVKKSADIVWETYRRRVPVESAGDTFAYLLSLVTLGLWTKALGHIAFVWINQVLPASTGVGLSLETDSLLHSRLMDSVASSMAQLTVGYSIYLWAMMKLNRELFRYPGQLYSVVRQLSIYLTVLVAVPIGIVTLIILLTAFFRGDLNPRLASKVAIVLAVDGSILRYYLRWLDGYSLSTNRIFMAVSLIATATGVITGLWILGQ